MMGGFRALAALGACSVFVRAASFRNVFTSSWLRSAPVATTFGLALTLAMPTQWATGVLPRCEAAEQTRSRSVVVVDEARTLLRVFGIDGFAQLEAVQRWAAQLTPSATVVAWQAVMARGCMNQGQTQASQGQGQRPGQRQGLGERQAQGQAYDKGGDLTAPTVDLAVAGVGPTFWTLAQQAAAAQSAAGLLLVVGRFFNEQEARSGKPVGVIAGRTLPRLGFESAQAALGKVVTLEWPKAVPSPPGVTEVEIVGVVIEPVDPALGVADRIATVDPGAAQVLAAGGPDLYVPFDVVSAANTGTLAASDGTGPTGNRALSCWVFSAPTASHEARRELLTLLPAPGTELVAGFGDGVDQTAQRSAGDARAQLPGPGREAGAAPVGQGQIGSVTGGTSAVPASVRRLALSPPPVWLSRLSPAHGILLLLGAFFLIPYLAGWGAVKLSSKWEKRFGHQFDPASTWKWILLAYGVLASVGLIWLILLPTLGIHLGRPAHLPAPTGTSFLISRVAEVLDKRLPYRTWLLVSLGLVAASSLGLATWYWQGRPQKLGDERTRVKLRIDAGRGRQEGEKSGASQRAGEGAGGLGGGSRAISRRPLTMASWLLARVRAHAFYSLLIGLSTLVGFVGIYTVFAQFQAVSRALLPPGGELASRAISLHSDGGTTSRVVEVRLADGLAQPLLATDLVGLQSIDGVCSSFAVDSPVAGQVLISPAGPGHSGLSQDRTDATPALVTVAIVRTTPGLWDEGWQWLAGAPWQLAQLNRMPSLIPGQRWEFSSQRLVSVGGEGVAVVTRDSAARLGLLSPGEALAAAIGRRLVLIADLRDGSDTVSVHEAQMLDPEVAGALALLPPNLAASGQVALGRYQVVGVVEPRPGVHPSWYILDSTSVAGMNDFAVGRGSGANGGVHPGQPVLFVPIYPWERVRNATILSAPGRNVDRVAAAVRSYADRQWGVGRFSVTSWSALARAGGGLQREVAQRNVAASVFMLLVGAFSLFGLFLLLGEGRRQHTLLARALGAPATSVWSQLLLEALTLGASGTALGLLALAFVAETFPAAVVELNWWPLEGRTLAVSALASLLLALLASGYPAWLNVRTSSANLTARE